ncbi:MAG: aminotransferase class V-fold PLP-dependent enzyme [Saprospiraceae bacterium]|nr:aminotransferase class V-fold PLP-dependent enzyme [Saprospiraceae bacterium]
MSDASNRYKPALEKAFSLGNEFLEGVDMNPVGARSSYEGLKLLWDWNLPQQGKAAEAVIEELNRSALPGLNLNQSGRFFAWVIGGSHPSAIAADWLTSAWDQNAGLYACTPSSSIVEEIAGSWLKQLLHLPEHASFTFVTGCQMANFTCLNVARNHLFQQAGWDIDKDGFYGAPRIRILCGDQKHNTITRALRMLGFGRNVVVELPSDEYGKLHIDEVKKEFERDQVTPTMVILQAGEIHTGAFDDFESIIPLAHKHKAWVHIDGAFGLWAAASPTYAHLMTGAEQADSWATDGHKWLNVPYDSGYAFIAHPAAHFKTFTSQAGYLKEDGKARDQYNWTPELSRRARGYTTYAVIKELGVSGIEKLVDRLCQHATSIVQGASQLPNTEVLAYPIINQGLLRFINPEGGDDESKHDHFTEKVIASINASGEAFFQPSTFKGKRCMRVSVSGWRTNEDDVRRTLAAIKEAIERVMNLYS